MPLGWLLSKSYHAQPHAGEDEDAKVEQGLLREMACEFSNH